MAGERLLGEGAGGREPSPKIYYLLWQAGRKEERTYFIFLLNYGAAPQIIHFHRLSPKNFVLASEPPIAFLAPPFLASPSRMVNSGKEVP